MSTALNAAQFRTDFFAKAVSAPRSRAVAEVQTVAAAPVAAEPATTAAEERGQFAGRRVVAPSWLHWTI
jgi:hypothetical protein